MAFFVIISINEKIAIFITTTIYAILDEVHQIFTPRKFAGIEDVTIDIMGIIVEICAYYVLK